MIWWAQKGVRMKLHEKWAQEWGHEHSLSMVGRRKDRSQEKYKPCIFGWRYHFSFFSNDVHEIKWQCFPEDNQPVAAFSWATIFASVVEWCKMMLVIASLTKDPQLLLSLNIYPFKGIKPRIPPPNLPSHLLGSLNKHWIQSLRILCFCCWRVFLAQLLWELYIFCMFTLVLHIFIIKV